MYYLHKILPWFLLPVGISALLVLAGCRFRRWALIWSGVAVIWLSSTPIVSTSAIRISEGRALPVQVADAPNVDAIVVLSGGRVVASGSAANSRRNGNDRFFSGIDLLKAGKSRLLVFTGGSVPWKPDARSEGDVLAEYAQAEGVPAAQILKTPRVTNTMEEAEAVALLLRARLRGSTWRGDTPRVLLVTSAFHMPRAKALFEREQIVVIPFPVDFRSPRGDHLSVIDFLPTLAALTQTQIALREGYGRLFYFMLSKMPS